MCRRKAKRLNGLCGTCHGITDKWKQCTHPTIRGKYCGRPHKTLDEIDAHKLARANRNKRRSQRVQSSPRTGTISPQRSAVRVSKPPSSPRKANKSRPSRPPGKPSPPRKPPSKKRNPNLPLRGPLSLAEKREAAQLCEAAIVTNDVISVFQSQVLDLVSDKVVSELTKDWDGRQCKHIAKLARSLLDVKNYFYEILADIVNWAAGKLGWGSTARIFACQFVNLVPALGLAKIIAAGRILQLSGICLCVMDGRSLVDCECLHDLVIFETKEAINRLMMAAGHDWRQLAQWPRKAIAGDTTQ